MAKTRTLKDIQRLFFRKKYSEVVRLLEPEVYRFRESFLYYSLLGLSCLYLQDGGGAFTYLHRALQIKEDDVTALLGLAAVHLKKRNLDEALKIWLRVLELDPRNRTAGRGLDRIRRGMSEEAISLLVDSGKIRAFFPPAPFRLSPAIFVSLLIGAGAVLGIALLIADGPSLLQTLRPGDPDRSTGRPEIESIELSGNALRTDSNSRARYAFTETEVDAIWKQAKDHFMAYRDNLAVYELNRLLNSNASAYIKESARRLKRFARTPGFKDIVDFRDNFTFRAVAGAPWLYDGCHVLWRGTIAGLVIGKEEIKFQFLVGSRDNRSFEGSASAVFNFADKLENDYYIELLGRVVPDGDRFHLQGVLNRRLHPDQPAGR